jgi:hypothetical protein
VVGVVELADMVAPCMCSGQDDTTDSSSVIEGHSVVDAFLGVVTGCTSVAAGVQRVHTPILTMNSSDRQGAASCLTYGTAFTCGGKLMSPLITSNMAILKRATQRAH